jgi:hypothetical protein
MEIYQQLVYQDYAKLDFAYYITITVLRLRVVPYEVVSTIRYVVMLVQMITMGW